MITEITTPFVDRKTEFIKILSEDPEKYWSYEGLLKEAIDLVQGIKGEDDYGGIDTSKIHCIDDGHYQGTLLFVIPEKTYQPSTYWVTKVYYGSCSGCDSLQHALDSNDRNEDLYSLTLHMLQGLKEI